VAPCRSIEVQPLTVFLQEPLEVIQADRGDVPCPVNHIPDDLQFFRFRLNLNFSRLNPEEKKGWLVQSRAHDKMGKPTLSAKY